MKKISKLFVIIIFLFSITLNAQTWETYTSKNDVQDICCVGDYCWVATTGGVVRVNIHDFSFKEFDVDDGLASNKAQAVINYNNQIWVGFDKGISLFNGSSWESVDPKGSAIMDYNIQSFAIDRNDNLWIGSLWGVWIYDNNQWIHFTENNSGLSSNGIHSILVDSSNYLWITNYYSIDVFDRETWYSYSKDNSYGINTYSFLGIEQESTGIIWVTSREGGIYYFKDDQWFNIDKTNSILPDNRFFCVLVDHNNKKWFGSESGGLYSISDLTLQFEISTDSLLTAKKINSIAEDINGNIWVGTNKGILFYNRQEWKEIKISQYFYSNSIRAVEIDDNNKKWIGSGGNLTILHNSIWELYNTKNSGMDFNSINDLSVNQNGHIWISSSMNGITMFDGEIWQNYNQDNSELPNQYISCIATQDSEIVWIGGYNSGLTKFDGKEFLSIPNHNMKNRDIVNIKIDKSDRIWICCTESDIYIDGIGLVCYDEQNNEWIYYNTSNSGIASNYVYDILFENDSTYWVSTSKGVSKFDGHEWISYNTDNSGLVYDWVISSVIDYKGRKWFGTYGHGLSMLEGEQWTTYTIQNSKLAGDHIFDIAVDDDGIIYIATDEGLSVIDETQTFIKDDFFVSVFPNTYSLQNYPNPFNSRTNITYEIQKTSKIVIEIYNSNGQFIKCLYNGKQISGVHSCIWDGRDENGHLVSSGIYLIKLIVNDDNISSNKVLLLK